MRRGDLFRVRKPVQDPKQFRVYVIVSRQALIDSKFPSVICAPMFSNAEGLSSQVPIGIDEGMKHQSWIMCDNLVSMRKSDLTQFVGSLSRAKLLDLNQALRMALDLP